MKRILLWTFAIVSITLIWPFYVASAMIEVPIVPTFNVVVDGNLGEWESIETPVVPIKHVVKRFPKPIDGPRDLSATFRLASDGAHLYVALEVTDDVIVLGEEGFSRTWNDDCVEIYFDGDLINVEKDYYDANDGQIRVSSHDGIHGSLEGVVMVDRIPTQLPLLWEVLGVGVVVSRSINGLTWEIAIPAGVFGHQGFGQDDMVGLNIRVIDDDNGGGLDHVISWQNDPESESWLTTRMIAPVKFVERGDTVTPHPPPKVTVKSTKDIVVTLEPRRVGTDLYSAIQALAHGRNAEAEATLKGLLDTPQSQEVQGFATYSLARMYKDQERWTEEAAYLERFLAVDLGSGWKRWKRLYAMWDLGWAYARTGAMEQARQIFEKALDQSPEDDLEAQYAYNSVLWCCSPVAKIIPSGERENRRAEYRRTFPARALATIEKGGYEAVMAAYTLARFYLDEQQVQEAVTAAGRGLEIDPHYENCRLLRAMALRRLGQLKEAAEDYQFVVVHSEDQMKVAPARLGLARCYQELGALDEAESAIRPYLETFLTERHKLEAKQILIQVDAVKKGLLSKPWWGSSE